MKYTKGDFVIGSGDAKLFANAHKMYEFCKRLSNSDPVDLDTYDKIMALIVEADELVKAVENFEVAE